MTWSYQWSALRRAGALALHVLMVVLASIGGAACGSSSKSATPRVTALTLASSSGWEGAQVAGTVTLETAAPGGGTSVALAADRSEVSLPPAVTVVAGDRTGAFTLRPGAVTAATIVNVTASSGGATESRPFRVLPTPGPGFWPRSVVDLPVGEDPATIALGDLDGDGHLDAAVTLHNANRVALFRGAGDGLAPWRELETGRRPWKVLAADLDRDGALDLVTADQAAGTVTVHLGRGDGTFRAGVAYPAGPDPGWVVAADLDGDGRLDLAVSGPPFDLLSYTVREPSGRAVVGLLKGNGDGTFRQMQTLLAGASPSIMAAGDLDGDGRLDLAVATHQPRGAMVLRGIGGGDFAIATQVAEGLFPTGLALADLDGDGHLDLLLEDLLDRQLLAARGRGDGTFAAPVAVPLGHLPVGLAVGDVDGDGHVDAVIATFDAWDNADTAKVAAYLGRGDGTFSTAVETAGTVGLAGFPALGDFDGDGHPEVVLANLAWFMSGYYPTVPPAVAVLERVAYPTLRIEPPRALGVSPGSTPLTFTATFGGAPYTEIHWWLDPAVGTLSATSGASVRYTPPAATGTAAAARLYAGLGRSTQAFATIGLSTVAARTLGTTTSPAGYLEYLPAGYGDGSPRPLLVFLQGSAGAGDGVADLAARMMYVGVPPMIAYGAWPADLPFVVLAPQFAEGVTCENGPEVAAFLAYALTTYRIDPKRVYLTGLSCGSFGAWDYLGLHTDEVVAAAVLLVGDPGQAWTRAGCGLGKVAIWAIHGTEDANVPIGPEREVMASLAACPSPPRREARFTEIQGAGHGIFDDVYIGRQGYDVFAWLLAHPKP